jgi:GH24 family phage-related lysozyme (muramidase)
MPQINAAGLALVEESEGCELTAYLDGGGIATIGYGHTSGVTLGMTCTQEQAQAWLEQDLEVAEKSVQALVEIELTPNEFAALVDFEYNTGALAASPGLALINERQFEAAWDDHFCLWVHDAAGNVEPGLVTRRAREKALFFS